MAADLKNSTNAIPGRPKLMLLSLAEQPIYEMPADTGGKLVLRLTNTSNEGATGAAARAYISWLQPPETAPGIRMFTKSLGPGESVDIPMLMGAGEFLSGKAETNAVISVLVHGVEFTSNVSTASGIQTDFVGSGGYSSNTGTVSGTNEVSTAANRRVYAALLAMTQTGASSASGFGNYDTFTMTCGGAAMTRKLVTDVKSSTTLLGSISLWEYVDPGSGTTPTITANVAKSGIPFNLTLATISKSGVGSTGLTAIDAPTSAAALNCSLASAEGREVLFVGGFNDFPNNLLIGGANAIRSANGNLLPATTRPHWLVFSDVPGDAAVNAVDSNSDIHAGMLMEILPA